MANEEQLAILKHSVEAWNGWTDEFPEVEIDLSRANLEGAKLSRARLRRANLIEANLSRADLSGAFLDFTDLRKANLQQADLFSVHLTNADLKEANLTRADLTNAFLKGADLSGAELRAAILNEAYLKESNLANSLMRSTIFGNVDLSKTNGVESVFHEGPSIIGTDTIAKSKGKIPEIFLRGCGLSDWEIEVARLYNPDLSNEEINNIQYKVYSLRASQALQISPVFISYSHADSEFVDKIGDHLARMGIRYWRDIHDMKAGRIETQIDRAISQNRTVLLVLSEHSLKSDWVEHEVRTARGLEKELERDVLCPVALDDSWNSSRWPKRIMEQIMEYNILDFSEWRDDSRFDGMFRKLIDGLELFYKG